MFSLYQKGKHYQVRPGERIITYLLSRGLTHYQTVRYFWDLKIRDLISRPSDVKVVVALTFLTIFGFRALFGGPFSFRVKSNDFNSTPVADLSCPAFGFVLLRLLVNVLALA